MPDAAPAAPLSEAEYHAHPALSYSVGKVLLRSPLHYQHALTHREETTEFDVGHAIHALVLIGGGAYTYARVPLGFWLQDMLGTLRNPYDKIGHFMQGFVPTMVAREILLRGDFVRGRRMVGFLCVCVAMAISACYELIEWAAAVALGQGADEFLGTQGDVWDTQSDMLFALLGGIVALLCLSRWHDRQIESLTRRPGATGR